MVKPSLAGSKQEDGRTHLADRSPQIEMPLRIEPPSGMKAPARCRRETRDEMVRRTSYSPEAFTARDRRLRKVFARPGEARKVWRESQIEEIVRERRLRLLEAHSTSLNSRVAQYSVLAQSAARANKPRAEGQAYLAIGIAQDNAKLYKDACSSYVKFVAAATKVNDPVWLGLGHNCLGVNCMLIACPPGLCHGAPPKESQLLAKAVGYHENHLRVADPGGQFVAHTNLGLCLAWMDDALAAARHHQDALRLAIELQSQSGQSIAVGNLGALALSRGDYATAQPCLDQHLQLVHDDPDAHVYALFLLGKLALATRRYEDACDRFDDAARVAKAHEMTGMLQKAYALIGEAKAMLQLPAAFDRLIADLSISNPAVGKPGYASPPDDDPSTHLAPASSPSSTHNNNDPDARLFFLRGGDRSIDRSIDRSPPYFAGAAPPAPTDALGLAVSRRRDLRRTML